MYTINTYLKNISKTKNKQKMLNLFKIKSFSSVRNYSKLNTDIIDSIKHIFGPSNISVSESVRNHYSKDESLHQFVYYS